ncbi:hypothetical protein Vadar_010483 [Vaccinium darrowii]|uniref:Uncharacterized protein n=1 Tax=Vaccinium darrowii TaxID=229202 RepID=A0ACB7Y633_9ERIC|nr:hypothetical protein Vadar_010483 [Vaccinium darrowii]
MVMMKRSGDIEARNKLLWLYLRDFYLELALVWLLAVTIGTVVVHVPAIPKFFLTTTPGIVLYTLALVAPFAGYTRDFLTDFLLRIFVSSFVYCISVLILCFCAKFSTHFSSNAVLLILFDVLTAFAAGLSCSLFHVGEVATLVWSFFSGVGGDISLISSSAEID